jgi:hypothetical protein
MEELSKVSDFIGKEVSIYPRDTRSKMGIVLDITPAGVMFKITKADLSSGYTVGEVVFISYSANLSFSCKENNQL